MSINTFEVDLQGQDLRIGIVQSRFNEEVCRGLLNACLGELKRLGVADEDILVATVPGALEIPVALQKMASREKPIISNWFPTNRRPVFHVSPLISICRSPMPS